jgi:hypothetical protein
MDGRKSGRMFLLIARTEEQSIRIRAQIEGF